MTRPIITWSYSALNDFKNCPFKYWSIKIGKTVSDINTKNMEGADYHEDFQHYVARQRALPPELQKYAVVLDKFRKAPGTVLTEQQWALDQNYQPCGFKDWDRAWVRAIADLAILNGSVAQVVDYKFGKPHKDPEQNSLVAAVMFQTYPQVMTVKSAYWYVLHNKFEPYDFKRENATAIWNTFLPAVNKLAEAKRKDEWPKTPNPLCGWCPVGNCHHNTNPNIPRSPT
jgi:hypothetical protein